MMQSAYFISDLHLHSKDLLTYTAFLHFLNKTAPQAQALYILGDLFEFWAGDDTVADSFHYEVARSLHQLSITGTQVFFMAGNRDFLIGPRFAKAAGLTLLKDPTRVTIADQQILLSHGDSLCTNDHGYMRLRRIIQHPFIKKNFLLLPKALRTNIAQLIHQKGRQHQKTLSLANNYRLDVAEESVSAMMQQYQTSILVHGHTHRPAQHCYLNKHIRWVLPDWVNGEGGYLFINSEGVKMQTLTHTPFSLTPHKFVANK